MKQRAEQVTYEYCVVILKTNPMKKAILILLTIGLASFVHGQTYYITTVAGTGSFGYAGDGVAATSTGMGSPQGMAIDADGNIYIADNNYHVIRKVNAGGIISTVAGTGGVNATGDGGPATAAQIGEPYDVEVDANGNLYIADSRNHVIRKIDTAGIITTIAGTAGVAGVSGDGGHAGAALLNSPRKLKMDGAGNLYVFDRNNWRVRKINASGVISTVAGTGLNYAPSSVFFYGDGSAATTTTLVDVSGLDADAAGNLYIADAYRNQIYKMTTGGLMYGHGHGVNVGSGFSGLGEIAVDDAGNLFVGAYWANRVLRIDTSGNTSVIAGTGPFTGAPVNDTFALLDYLLTAFAIETDNSGNIYVGQMNEPMVRKLYFVNYAPIFTGGPAQTLSVCKNSGTHDINALASVSDADTADTLTWTVVTAPAHGTLAATYSAATTGGTITPTGFTYTPTTGYSGTDLFRIRVFDGLEADTTTVSVTVDPLLPAITGAANVCLGSTTTLANTTGGGTWSSDDTTIAAIDAATGVVSGLSVGTSVVSYTTSSGCTKSVVATVNPVPAAITGDPVVCIGQGNQLSNAITGGTWTSSSGTIAYAYATTGVISGISAGTATITYRLAGGCNTTMQVTVNNIPDAITGSAATCVGATTTLSHSETGGTWSSSNTARATVDAATGEVTAISFGTCTITYRVSPGCYRTIMLTVNSLPGVISGTQLLCVGSTVTLSSGTNGCTWSSSDGSVATVSGTGVVTGITEGTATISYTNANGCARTAIVTANAAVPANTGTPEVCVGFTTTLSNAASGGTWASSATSKATVNATTGVVTSVAAGTSNISYITSAGCRSITQVTVNAAVPTITGATSVCIDAVTTYSNTATGGSWSSSNTALGSIDPSTGVLTGIAAGALSITYTLPTGCFKTKAVTVNALPGTIMGTTTVCIAATTTLSGSPGYSWTSGNTAIATVGATSGIVTGVAAGTVDITFHTTSGCTTSTVVTVQSLPDAISGTLTVCQGATTTLSSTGTPGGTWASSNTAKATVGSSTGVVTGVSSGTPTITYTGTNTCRRTIVVTVNTLPSAATITGTTTMSVTATQTLTASQSGGTWTSADPSIASMDAATGYMTGVATGNVVVSYERTNGCGTTTNTRTFTITAARPGVQASGAAAAFSVYPNPTQGALTLETPVAGVFTVYTIDGKTVGSYSIDKATTTITLPQGITAGIYIGSFIGRDGTRDMVRMVYEP